jgi:uncharacterized protein
MGKRTEHAPGTFSWVELSTNDVDGAKNFYGGLFGWDFDDQEIPAEAGGGVYVMCEVDGDHAAAISQSREGDPTPPHWNNYVTVASADDAAAKGTQSGGDALMEPFDVMTAGRMAVLSDPTGAAFAVWQPNESIGAERVNDPGCLTWNELHTTDVDAAVRFYESVFGWTTDEVDTQGGPRYVIISNGDRRNGGIMDAQEGEPANWMPYFVVTSRDAAADWIGDLGGKDLARMEMPQGKIAILQDPQGAAFGIWEGDTDD